MKLKRVGTWALGLYPVELFANPNNEDGTFLHFPDDKVGPPIRMEVGIGQKHWHQVLEVLLHETIECAMVQIGVCWKPSPDFAQTSSGYLFVMDHEQFANVAARCSTFVASAAPALKAIYDKFQKTKKGKK